MVRCAAAGIVNIDEIVSELWGKVRSVLSVSHTGADSHLTCAHLRTLVVMVIVGFRARTELSPSCLIHDSQASDRDVRSTSAIL